jgi:hypothetical protein
VSVREGMDRRTAHGEMLLDCFARGGVLEVPFEPAETIQLRVSTLVVKQTKMWWKAKRTNK